MYGVTVRLSRPQDFFNTATAACAHIDEVGSDAIGQAQHVLTLTGLISNQQLTSSIVYFNFQNRIVASLDADLAGLAGVGADDKEIT